MFAYYQGSELMSSTKNECRGQAASRMEKCQSFRWRTDSHVKKKYSPRNDEVRPYFRIRIVYPSTFRIEKGISESRRSNATGLQRKDDSNGEHRALAPMIARRGRLLPCRQGLGQRNWFEGAWTWFGWTIRTAAMQMPSVRSKTFGIRKRPEHRRFPSEVSRRSSDLERDYVDGDFWGRWPRSARHRSSSPCQRGHDRIAVVHTYGNFFR